MAINPPLGGKLPGGLTRAAWLKKKSFIDKAKAATQTGLGAELKKVEDAWNKTDWKTMKAIAHGKWHSHKELLAARKAAKDYYADYIVVKLYNAVMSGSRKARTTSTTAGLSGAAKAYAIVIADGLKGLADQLLSIDFKDYDDDEKRMLPLWDLARKAMVKNVADLETKLKALEKAPTNANWSALGVKDAFRSVANGVATNPDFASLWPTPWQKLDGLQNESDPVLSKLKDGAKVTDAEKKAILALIKQGRSAITKVKAKM